MARVESTSWKVTSKEVAVNWSVRRPGAPEAVCQLIRRDRPRWVIATPLGTPVEPEV